jgi:acetolactate synthase-1/3 small subunit
MSNPSTTNTEVVSDTKYSVTITMTVDEQGGELERIMSLLRRRIGTYSTINITAQEEVRTSRATINLHCTSEKANLAFENLQKMPGMRDVQMYYDNDAGSTQLREFALIRLGREGEQRSSLIKLINAAGARVIDVTDDGLTIEVSGSPATIDAFMHQLSPYGIRECVRTGGLTLKQHSEQ